MIIPLPFLPSLPPHPYYYYYYYSYYYCRRMARRACKAAVDFFLLAPDGWITDTSYNATKGVVTIESFINVQLAPAGAR